MYKFFILMALSPRALWSVASILISNPERKPPIEISHEDYVLIEFAARLEEDYHKMEARNL